MSNNKWDFGLLPNGLKLFGLEKDYILETIRKTGAFYEQELLSSWFPYIEDSKTILDIGANIGNHSLFWASSIKDAQVYSFEPVHETYELLCKNIQENHLEDQVHAENYGVGEKQSYASVKERVENNLGATTLEGSDVQTEDHIKIVSIDSFFTEDDILADFIKIDTEGWEMQVLHGMTQLLSLSHPTIWVEASSTSIYALWELMTKFGYVLADIRAYNMLWLHPERVPEVQQVETSKIIMEMYEHIEKRYSFYSLYERTKAKLAAANEKYSQQGERYNTLKEQLSKSQNQVAELKNELEKKQEQHALLEEQIKDIKQDFHLTMRDDIELFASMKEQFSHLQMQNSYLQRENAEYRRKLSMITDTLPGKVAMKVYRWLKRIKNKLARLFR